MGPPFSETDVLVTDPQWGCSAVVEPLGLPITGNLAVATTLREGDVVQSGEPLEFSQESNTVTVSHNLSADSRTPPKWETEDMARWQRKGELPTGINLDHFPGTEIQKEETLRLCSHYKDVFAADKEDLGCTSTVYHRIHTEDDVPVMERHRRIPPNVYQEVKQHLHDLLKKEVIQPSKSDYASRLFSCVRSLVDCACA